MSVKKNVRFVFTGGDNCYCGECGGVCDRRLMLIDKENKVLHYLPFSETCLGKWCWYLHGNRIRLQGDWADWYVERRDDTKIVRGKLRTVSKYVITNGDIEYPVSITTNKWGKDGEYGKYGSIGKETEKGFYDLEAYRNNETYWEWERTIGTPEYKGHDYYYVPTGWKLKKGVA